jgi:ribose/xylose/arabinose/galactoside ABC-type transport system permease subunit
VVSETAVERPRATALDRLRALALRPEAGLPLILVGLAIYLGFASEYFWRWQNILNITEAV